MTTTPHRVTRRPNMRRAVVLFPSGLTLGNLFFGVFAIITASRGDFRMAGIWVLWGGLCDVFDGRIARAANAGTEFGEELDSLVDAISFGLAPAMIMYFAVLNRDGWDWIFVFLFAACAVMRLARFNIEQAGTAKTYFQGLPSPAAGITLASYYWFSQSWLYSYGAIGDLPWQELLRFLMAALAFLMISNIPYPVVPRVGFRSLRAIGASILVFGSLALLATKRLEFFFPLCIGYVAFGLFRSLFFRIFERRQPTVPYDLSEGEDDDEEEDVDIGSSVHASRQGHREPRPPREDRTKRGRPDVKDAVPRTDERPPRAERPDRPERPQRTEAERAERKAKRDKRDKRDKREDRPARPVAAAPSTNPVVEALVAPDGTLNEGGDEVLGIIPAGDAASPGREGAPRKRKRRRRRGERTGRGPSDGEGGNDSNDGGEGGDDVPSSFDAAPSDYAPPPPPPAPPQQPAPAPAPERAPSPSQDSPE